MERIYEGMFLIDNAVVREGWDKAKSLVTALLEKHGANVLSARRWDERRLSYPIKGKNRATFLLAYYNVDPDAIPAMRRDFELNESVLRSLELVVDAVPESEAEHVSVESAADFKVPTPPDDDHVEFVEEPEDEGRRRYDDRDRDRGRDRDRDRDRRPGSDGPAEKTGDAKPETTTKAEEPAQGEEAVSAKEDN